MKNNCVECNPKPVKLVKSEPIRFKLKNVKLLRVDDNIRSTLKVKN